MSSESQDKMRSAFFNEADILFWLWDKDLNLIDVNEATLKTFHFKREDVIGKNICEISPDSKSSGRFYEYQNVIKTGKTFLIDEVKSHPSLGNFCFRLKAFKVGEGMGSVITNITDLKDNIEELETFIYKSTHDMRSPIASILGLLSITETEKNDPSESQRYFGIIKQQIGHLDNILQKLIETTRIRKNEKIIQLIDFKVTIEHVINSLAFMNGFKDIKFETFVSVNQKFHSDKLLIVSIFQNIIDNAIKYRNASAKNSFIKIEVADQNGGVKIIIEDNGIGIEEHLQKEVFKMFYRATDQSSGSGLGLYTVSHTLKKLNGQIKLSSKEKSGTTFTIYIPNEKKAAY